MQNYVLLTLDNNLEAPQVAFLQTHQPIFYQIRNPDMALIITRKYICSYFPLCVFVLR